MSRFVFKLPDLGEGTVDAEIVTWRVKPGDVVYEDDIIAEVMTEKAVVEVPAPVSGQVIAITGEPGERVPVGSDLITFETEASDNSPADTEVVEAAAPAPVQVQTEVAPPRGRVLTSPAIRRKAREAGIDLTALEGSGPHGRIMHPDIDRVIAAAASQSSQPPQRAPADSIDEVKVIGLRRVIAQRMADAKRNIPHFSYVEEVDVTDLEALRCLLNEQYRGREPLTYLPFLVIALVRALREFPQCNAWYDAERGVLQQHRAVHAGIATQSPDGLKVAVVRNAHRMNLWEVATEIRRVSDAARSNRASREEPSGSTITVSSLGKLGGIVSTPIINSPELAIIGVNRAVERPVVRAGSIIVRRMMNLSSSFDHRLIDGHVAASLIQRLRALLEQPAMLFIPDPDQSSPGSASSTESAPC